MDQKSNHPSHEDLIKEIERLKQVLEESHLTKNRFIMVMAHDLINPIYGIHESLDFFSREWDYYTDTEKKDNIQLLLESSKNITVLLNNLLLWSKYQMNVLPILQTNVSIREAVNRNIELYKNIALTKNIQIQNQIISDREIQFDFYMLDTIVRNLINNAVKFTPEDGSVTISLDESPDYLILRVADTGNGISPEDHEKLFKIDSTFHKKGTRNENGSGLGLILCKDFIEKNGGRISVVSKEHEGSTFIIELCKGA